MNNNKLINEKLICAFRWSVLPSIMKMHGPKKQNTSSRLMKIGPVPKIPRKYSTGTQSNSLFFLSLEKLIIPRKGGRNNEKIKSNGREIDSENRPNTSGLQGHKMQRKESMKTDIHNQKQLKILIRNALRAGNITCK